MTDKELRKLNRGELIDILIYLETELEKANAEVKKLKKQLEENTGKTHNLLDALKVINGNVKLLCKSSNILPEEILESDLDLRVRGEENRGESDKKKKYDSDSKSDIKFNKGDISFK